MKHYYARFKETAEAIEVDFPDLKGCVTFGSDWEEAIENAEDALAAWLANAELAFINKPSTHKMLLHLKGKLVPIPVNESILESYKPLKRFNVIFPTKILQRVDRFRKQAGLKRSTLLQKAAEEYLKSHQSKSSVKRRIGKKSHQGTKVRAVSK